MTVPGHAHGHGGALEIRAHDAGPGRRDPRAGPRGAADRRPDAFLSGQADAIRLGTLYALGHGAVVIALGLAAIAFGALLPDWLDPIMGRDRRPDPRRARRCGSCTRSTATPGPARRSGCAAAGCSSSTAMRYGWRRFQARLHGHEHVEPLEMSSYGARTSFGVGMIHGVGAETGTQVLLIAAVGGAVERRARRPDAVRLRARPADLELRDRAAQLGRLRRRARRASGSTSRSAPSPGCSACSSGRSSCSASTRSCRTWARPAVLTVGLAGPASG